VLGCLLLFVWCFCCGCLGGVCCCWVLGWVGALLVCWRLLWLGGLRSADLSGAGCWADLGLGGGGLLGLMGCLYVSAAGDAGLGLWFWGGLGGSWLAVAGAGRGLVCLRWALAWDPGGWAGLSGGLGGWLWLLGGCCWGCWCWSVGCWSGLLAALLCGWLVSVLVGAGWVGGLLARYRVLAGSGMGAVAGAGVVAGCGLCCWGAAVLGVAAAGLLIWGVLAGGCALGCCWWLAGGLVRDCLLGCCSGPGVRLAGLGFWLALCCCVFLGSCGCVGAGCWAAESSLAGGGLAGWLGLCWGLLLLLLLSVWGVLSAAGLGCLAGEVWLGGAGAAGAWGAGLLGGWGGAGWLLGGFFLSAWLLGGCGRLQEVAAGAWLALCWWAGGGGRVVGWLGLGCC